MWEFTNPLGEKGIRIDWKEKPGFVDILVQDPVLRSTVSVIPFHTKNCESIFFTTRWWRNMSGVALKRLYREYRQGHYTRLPIFCILAQLSAGLFFFPRPVKLDTFFGDPITVREDETAAQFSERIKEATQLLIDRVEGMSPLEQVQEQEYPQRNSWRWLCLRGVINAGLVLFVFVPTAITWLLSVAFYLFFLHPLYLSYCFLFWSARRKD